MVNLGPRRSFRSRPAISHSTMAVSPGFSTIAVLGRTRASPGNTSRRSPTRASYEIWNSSISGFPKIMSWATEGHTNTATSLAWSPMYSLSLQLFTSLTGAPQACESRGATGSMVPMTNSRICSNTWVWSKVTSLPVSYKAKVVASPTLVSRKSLPEGLL